MWPIKYNNVIPTLNYITLLLNKIYTQQRDKGINKNYSSQIFVDRNKPDNKFVPTTTNSHERDVREGA